MIGRGYREVLEEEIEGALDSILRELGEFKERLMQKDDFNRWQFTRTELHDSLLDIMEKL